MTQEEIFVLWFNAVPGVPYAVESAPPGRRVLLWWTPKFPNPSAECWITANVCGDQEPGKYWHGNGATFLDGYGDLERITHWTPLPGKPT